MSSQQPLPIEPTHSSMDLVREAEAIAALSKLTGVVSVQDMAPRLVKLVCDTMVTILGKMEHIEDMAAAENEGEIREIAEDYLEKTLGAEIARSHERYDADIKVVYDMQARIANLESQLAALATGLQALEVKPEKSK